MLVGHFSLSRAGGTTRARGRESERKRCVCVCVKECDRGQKSDRHMNAEQQSKESMKWMMQ